MEANGQPVREERHSSLLQQLPQMFKDPSYNSWWPIIGSDTENSKGLCQLAFHSFLGWSPSAGGANWGHRINSQTRWSWLYQFFQWSSCQDVFPWALKEHQIVLHKEEILPKFLKVEWEAVRGSAASKGCWKWKLKCQQGLCSGTLPELDWINSARITLNTMY